jgi:hypothetical protein
MREQLQLWHESCAANKLTMEVACISSIIARALGATLGHILPGSSSPGPLRTAVNPPSSRKHCDTTQGSMEGGGNVDVAENT